MKILICNERFLFRFGADRVLILLGKFLKDLGYTISIMGNRFDSEIVKTFASQIIELPKTDDYFNMNEFTNEWLQSSWHKHFNKKTAPDIILVGGWPFFSSIPFLKKVGSAVIFNDFGAVPLEGYSEGDLIIQKKLRSLRKQYLREVSLVVGISDFIVNSQSKPDSDGKVPVRTVLLGADHMEMSIWPAEHLSLEKSQGYAINLINDLKSQSRKIILSLGRWEPNCYKNSNAAFDIMPQINNVFSNCTLLILADPIKTRIPSAFKNTIFPIGFPDDRELFEIMKSVDLGLSFSLWEGFNLPLAEMQWLDSPALAFDLAAHSEVVLHPWYLCKNNQEMANKACDILSGGGIDSKMRAQSFEKFRKYFRWSRFVDDYCKIFEKILNDDIVNRRTNINNEKISIVVDVTNSSKDPANSGVVRVTRRLCRELQKYTNPIFVVWQHEKNCYALPTKNEFQMLSQFNGPLLHDEDRLSSDAKRILLKDYLNYIEKNSIWMLFPETVNEAHAHKIRSFARDNGFKIAAVFYDAIPVLHPELCKDIVIRDNHSNYMRGLAECDVIIPISNFSGSCLKDFWADNKIKETSVITDVLPGEFGGSIRHQDIQDISSNEIHILCVSTLEPRKNHLRLVQACLLMQKKHPDLNWSLTLVGNRYAGAFEIATYIESIAAKNPRIKWVGIVDDATLQQLYEKSSFTIYPSIIEGFGMPILESIWHGKPCICSRDGVMAELAAEGGCLTTNVLDEDSLSETIYKLSTNKELLLKLTQEAIKRKIKTWDEYVQEFISILKTYSKEIKITSRDRNVVLRQDFPFVDNRTLQDIIYPDCLCDNWQMNNSERLAITAILSRIKPQCSIEVGSRKGGSLSLILQYSKMVFSIDIDPSIPEKFKQIKNVSFLTGPSSVILPLLLDELDKSGIGVDFILIDGDHSAEDIKHNISCLLTYVPKRPILVLIHDSFNPEYRRSMLEANWRISQYVEYIDLDFIPGRIIKDDGPSHEMGGGLALVYLIPKPHIETIQINRTAEMMFTILGKSKTENENYTLRKKVG